MEIQSMIGLKTEHNEEYVVGLGKDTKLYEWKWETGEWVLYKKA